MGSKMLPSKFIFSFVKTLGKHPLSPRTAPPITNIRQFTLRLTPSSRFMRSSANHRNIRPNVRTGKKTQLLKNDGAKSKEQQFHPPHPSVIEKLAKLEDSMRLFGYSTFRIGLSVLVVGGIGVYIFREFIREKAADEVSTVAYKSLGDQNVKIRAGELAKALLKAILNDPVTKSQAVRFFEEVFTDDGTKTALSNLILKTLNDPGTRPKLVALLKTVTISAMQDPVFRKNLASNIKLLLQDPNTKDGVLDILRFTLNDEQVNEQTKVFIRRLLESSRVRNATVDLGKQVVKGVVNDAGVQKQVGDAVWATAGHSVTPRLLRRGESGPSRGTDHKVILERPQVQD